MTDLFKIRRDTAANWTAANPVLHAGEPGQEIDAAGDPYNVKVGDGVTAWNDLDYLVPEAVALTDADIAPVAPNDQVASYTFVLADRARVVTGSNAAAITFTIPPNSAVAFPLGTALQIAQKGAGRITVAAGAGVTLRTPHGAKTSAQYSIVTAIQLVADVWYVTGDTTT